MPRECDGSEVETRWHVSVSGGAFRSTLSFDGTHTDVAEGSILAVAGYDVRPGLSVSLGAGAVLDGSLQADGGASMDMDPGPAASASVSWLLLPETARRPFLFTGLSLSVVTAMAGGARFTAGDARATLLVGKSFFDRLIVYAGARVFVGPVSWELAGESVSGSDIHHYTVGAGARLALPGQVDLFVEGMALGEQSANGGVGIRF